MNLFLKRAEKIFFVTILGNSFLAVVYDCKTMHVSNFVRTGSEKLEALHYKLNTLVFNSKIKYFSN